VNACAFEPAADRIVGQVVDADGARLAGGHAKIIPELTELVNQNPLSEQFCSLLMVALYRAGRQADALELYRQLRQRFAEELGIEPSPVLRQYEVAILNHDPLLTRIEPEPVGANRLI
jgi:DNA-binding SARP family transcriptional activator